MSKQPHYQEKSNASQLLLICLIIIIYALCYQIQSPLQPFLVQKLIIDQYTIDNASFVSNLSNSNSKNIISFKNESQATEIQGKNIQNKQEIAKTDKQQFRRQTGQAYAKMKSFFSIVQWFCALGYGYILDRWGIKTGFKITFVSCALSYYLLSISNNISTLYLSKLPGIGMAGYLCAQAAVIKLTQPGIQRIKWLGFMATSYTIGGTIGPYIGGVLGSNGDYYTSAKFATIASMICLVIVFLLPRSLNNIKLTIHLQNHKQLSSLQKIKSICKFCGFLLILKFITCIVSSMARSTEPLILKDFGVREQQMGKILSAQFCFGGFTNAFLIAPITQFLGGNSRKVIEKCLILMAATFIFQFVLFGSSILCNYKVEAYVAIILLYAIFQHTLAVSSTSQNSALISKQYQGTLLGIEHSLFAAGFMIGPRLGVMIWQQYGILSLNMSCALIILLCIIAALKFIENKQKQE